MGTHSAILVGLSIYAIAMLAVSLFWLRRVKKATEYLVGGRGLGYWILTGTITATGVGTGVIIGGSGLAYRHGWAGCAYPIGLGVGTMVAGLCFAGMRRYNFMTLSEEIASYYGGNRIVVEFANIGLFISQLCWLTVQIIGGGAVLSAVTGMRPDLCMVLAGLVTASISIPGGLMAVVYTDFLQAAILLCGFACLTYASLHNVGGWTGLREAVPSEYFSLLGVESAGWERIVSLLAALISSVIADPARRLTMYSARSVSAGRWSMLSAGVIEIVLSIGIGITGMYALVLNSGLEKADEALPWLVMHVLPPWLAALVVVSVTSGIISAANGNATATGTFFVRHIYPLATGRYPKRPVAAVRCALVCAFLLATALSLVAGNIVDFVLKFLPVTISGLAVVILFGRFWRRATWQGALAALVVAPLVSLAVLFLPAIHSVWKEPILPATLAGMMAHLVVSVCTVPNARSFEDVATEMTRERQAVEV
jgi:solute:Na+ symporter, SSS family